jgi:hypothetical protein
MIGILSGVVYVLVIEGVFTGSLHGEERYDSRGERMSVCRN